MVVQLHPARPTLWSRLSAQRTTGCVALGALAFAAATVRLSGFRDLRQLSARSKAPSAAMSSRSAASIAGGAGMVREGGGRNATAAVIFMHGLGDTAAGWAGVFPLPGLGHVRAVLPTAATARVSLNGGMPMPSWFDLYGLDAGAREDGPGITAAIARVELAIDEVVAAGIPRGRVVVAGFSQGGALALSTALRTSRKIAGVVALSSWLPLGETYPAALAQGARDVPVLMGHGDADMVVRFAYGQESARKLEAMGLRVKFKTYSGMGHSACEAELDDLKDFLASVLPEI